MNRKPVYALVLEHTNRQGNTYHSVRILFSEGPSRVSGKTYGGNNQWAQTLKEMLDLPSLRIPFEVDVVKVRAEKELHLSS